MLSGNASLLGAESYMSPSDSTPGSVQGQSQSNDKHDDLPCVEPSWPALGDTPRPNTKRPSVKCSALATFTWSFHASSDLSNEAVTWRRWDLGRDPRSSSSEAVIPQPPLSNNEKTTEECSYQEEHDQQISLHSKKWHKWIWAKVCSRTINQLCRSKGR